MFLMTMWAILDTSVSKTPIESLPDTRIGNFDIHHSPTLVPPTQLSTSIASNDIALKIENLSKIYDSGAAGKVVALRKINLIIKKGEFVSIVGPSGSGKSTLLNMIGALDRPTVGKVYIGGTDIFSLKDTEIATIRN